MNQHIPGRQRTSPFPSLSVLVASLRYIQRELFNLTCLKLVSTDAGWISIDSTDVSSGEQHSQSAHKLLPDDIALTTRMCRLCRFAPWRIRAVANAWCRGGMRCQYRAFASGFHTR